MKDDRPLGALLVVAVLAVVIIVSWFGVYAIYAARS
jgi:cytochrome b